MEEFNVLEFLKYYFSKIIFILIFTFVGLVGGIFYTTLIQVPVYRSQTSLVLTKNDSSTITQNDIDLLCEPASVHLLQKKEVSPDTVQQLSPSAQPCLQRRLPLPQQLSVHHISENRL